MSNPYPPLTPAPHEFTLDRALAATIDAAGRYHVGKLEFADKRTYNDFATAQRELGGDATQLATLYHLRSTGHDPHAGPMLPPPAGTTVDALLDIKGKTPDAAGFYELGTLRVHEGEFARFAALQRDLTARNPEALAALYHMEHAPDKPVTFRVTTDADRNDRFDPRSNTMYWNPNTAVRDAYDGRRVAPDTAALHEETHWAGRDVGPTLQRVPAGPWQNHEEKRVIEHAEARDMQLVHRDARHSHYGYVLPVARIASIDPSLTVTQGGVAREVRAPYRQSGHVLDVSADGHTTLAIRGQGAHADHQVSYETEQLSLAMGGDLANARRLLADARTHHDSVTFGITNDGKLSYADPAQAQRLQAHPDPALVYPQPMQAVETLPAARQSVEVSR